MYEIYMESWFYRFVELRFRVIRPRERKKLSYLLPEMSFCSFFAVLDFPRRILAFINTYSESSKRIAARSVVISRLRFARYTVNNSTA